MSWKFPRRTDASARRPAPAPDLRPPCRCIGDGWRRSLLSFGLAGSYSLALTWGTAEQSAFLARLIQAFKDTGCEAPPAQVAPPDRSDRLAPAGR